MTTTTYRNLVLADGRRVDIVCAEGRITSILPANAEDQADMPSAMDCEGQLVLPALVEPHVHLDKTMWGMPWHPAPAGLNIPGYIANERRILKTLSVPIAKRSAELLAHCIAQGSLTIRSHVDVAPDIGLKHIEDMLALRSKYKALCNLDLVAFPQTGLFTSPGTQDLMEEALKMGVETVGGIDPAGIDRDPIRHLRTIFDMAVKHGCGLDIHLHDHGDLGLWEIERIADLTEANGLQGKVMISHAYCLGMVRKARAEAVADRLNDLSISIMTAVPIEPGAPPVAMLRAHGVNVCCGSDGIRDSWSPMGNGDMLERAFLLAFRFDWSTDEEFAMALDCATSCGAKALGIDDYGLEPGRPADFLILPAANAGDALCNRPHARTVVRGGRIIARDGKLVAEPLS